MKKSILLFITVASFLCILSCHADEIISFFFKPYPAEHDQAHVQTICANLKDPNTHNAYCMSIMLDHTPVAGIFATYGGYMAMSDMNGQITFPRKHSEAKVYLLITQTITPLFMTNNTIHHWELNDGIAAQLFSAEHIQDKESGDYYWYIQAIPLPTDNIVPLESILIFAKPSNLVVQTGMITVGKTQHLLLPDIYVKKGINITKNALYILNLRHFFGRSKKMIRIKDKSYTTLFAH